MPRLLDRLTVGCLVLAAPSSGVAYYAVAVFWHDRPANQPELVEATIAMGSIATVVGLLGLVLVTLLRSPSWVRRSAAAVVVALVAATGLVASTISRGAPAPHYSPYVVESVLVPLLIPLLWPLALLTLVVVMRRVTAPWCRVRRSRPGRSSAPGRRASAGS